ARPGRRVELIEEQIPRDDLLHWLGRSIVTLFLPNLKEGFYLPALQGMALGTVVVCPDCIGNRSFCLAGENCFRPPYDERKLIACVEAGLSRPDRCASMLERARRTAEEHDLGVERKAFHEVLDHLDEIWAAT